MKKLLMLSVLPIVASALFLITCGDDDNSLNNPLDPEDPVFVNDTPAIKIDTPEVAGNWEGGMTAFPPYLKDSIKVTVSIKMDSSYKLSAVYATSGDTTLIDNGYWKISSDTIYLNGYACSIYDTTLKILKPLESCGEPAAIKIAIDNKTSCWLVPLITLTPLSAAFNIDLTNQSIKGMLALLSLPLYKK